MKKVLLSVAFIAANFYFHGEAAAQVSKISSLPGTDLITVNSDIKADNQTVLSGNWTVSTDATGRVFIADKNHHVVRIYTGAEMKALSATERTGGLAAASPFLLSVDKQGRLHIVDKTALVSGKLKARILPHEQGTFSDPDMPMIVEEATVVLNNED